MSDEERKRKNDEPLVTPKRKRKEAKEDALLEKAIRCMETGISKIVTTKHDSDKIFAEFIASELRSIEDNQVKRMLKWKIQNVLYGSDFNTPLSWCPPNTFNYPYQRAPSFSSPTSSIRSQDLTDGESSNVHVL